MTKCHTILLKISGKMSEHGDENWKTQDCEVMTTSPTTMGQVDQVKITATTRTHMAVIDVRWQISLRRTARSGFTNCSLGTDSTHTAHLFALADETQYANFFFFATFWQKENDRASSRGGM